MWFRGDVGWRNLMLVSLGVKRVKSFVFFLYQSIFRADSNPSSRRDMTPYSLVAQSSQIYLSQVHVFPLSDIDGKLLFYATWRKTLYSVPWLGPVVWRLVGANPRLNFNVGFFIPLRRSLFGIIFSIPFFIASHNQIPHKRKYTKFLVYTLRFHTNPGIT